MKKSLFVFLMLIISTIQSYAAYNPEKQFESIAEALLTKNGIVSSNIKFELTSKSVDNSTFFQDRVINISKENLSYAKNDNETAAVIANELGHIISGHASKGKFLSSFTTSSNSEIGNLVENYKLTKEEKEADTIAVNLTANAGYNPLAAIVVLTRQTATYWDSILAKPANAERAMNIYDYTSYAYPEKLKAGYNCNEYKNFLIYANNILNQRKENKKELAKVEKQMKKYRKESLSKISKFKTRGGISGWDAALGILNNN